MAQPTARLSRAVSRRTCTGELGIGCAKIDFLPAEDGEAVSVMLAALSSLSRSS
jgi:hypothetical protein